MQNSSIFIRSNRSSFSVEVCQSLNVDNCLCVSTFDGKSSQIVICNMSRVS
jgi:hypothetical protein